MQVKGKRVKKKVAGAVTVGSVLALDVISKLFAMSEHSNHGNTKVADFFNIVEVWNSGIGFGVFSALRGGNTLFACISMLAVIALFYVLRKSETTADGVCISAIIGGALGNLVDRIRFGAVYDFIDLSAGGVHWPAFNIADASITFGGMALLVRSLQGNIKGRRRHVE